MRPVQAPPPLAPGATIGIVSPSGPAAGLFPQRFDRGVSQLRELGFEVVLGPHCRAVTGSAAGSARDRAGDLNAFFRDPSVRCIVASIGGTRSADILPYLDWDAVAADPKILVGYSDITVILQAVLKMTGVVTYYGPTLMTEFAEYPEMPSESRDSFISALEPQSEPLSIAPYAEALTNRVDWASPAEGSVPRDRGASPPPVTVRGGTARGHTTGGCIEALERLRGTRYWPDTEGALLLLETASDSPNHSYLETVFTDYRNMGVWDGVAGVVFGRKLWPERDVLEVAHVLEELTTAPVLIGLDFGHISPIATIPFGLAGTLDSTNAILTID